MSMSINKMTRWIILATVVAAFIVVGMVHDAYKEGLTDGRQQACARLDHDHAASFCEQLIEKDVALDERVDEEVKRK